MNFKLVLVLTIVTTLTTSQHPEIIDFTYTQLLEEANYTGGFIDKIVIKPDTAQLEKYQFPQVCKLQESLKQGSDKQGTEVNKINLDDYLQTLRDKILHLAQTRIADQELTQLPCMYPPLYEEISKHIEFTEETPILEKFKIQLQSLAKKESQLSVSKQRIEELTKLLNKKINDYNNSPKSQQFKSASLNFQIQNYNSKIKYLKDLKESSISEAKSQPHINFTDFFTQLGSDLRNESKQIQFIDKYFQNVSHLKYLKDTADSLRDNIQVDRLNIEYKRKCQKEKKDIISKPPSHSQIKETLDHLREKKKQFGNTTNKYCQGVALKLEMQIKRLLKAINWTFSCADGLKELEQKLQMQILKLQDLQLQISTYGSLGFDNYHDQYEKTKEMIQKKFQLIKTFNIDQYSHDPAQIDHLIQQSQRGKRDAEEKLKDLPKQISGDQNFNQIRALAQEIKREKAKFCHYYGSYDVDQRNLWFQIYRYQNIQTYSSKMRGEFLTEGQKLQELENEYKNVSQIITQEIVHSYLAKEITDSYLTE